MWENDERKDEEIIEKLYAGWKMNMNDAQSCIFANISMNKLLELYKKVPNLESERNVLQTNPGYKAKKIINESLDNGSTETAKWLLERVEKETYSTKVITEEDNSQINKKLEEMDKFLADFGINDTTRKTE